MTDQDSVQRVLGGRRVTIPNDYADALSLKEGDLVILTIDLKGKSITIVPAEAVPR